jgi:internalin A
MSRVKIILGLLLVALFGLATEGRAGTFARMCEDTNTPESARNTIVALLKLTATSDCVRAEERLVAREELVLEGLGLVDLSPLAGLTRLRGLAIGGNRFHSLEALRKLERLEWIFVAGNQAPLDLAGLENLSSLQYLDISDTPVRGLSPLNTSTSLKYLVADGCALEELSALAAMSDLVSLSLNRNAIADLQPLAALSRLQRLYLRQNQIASIDALEGLRQLEELDVSDNPIGEVEVLSHLESLSELSLARTRVGGLGFLSSLIRLQWLNLSGLDLSHDTLLALSTRRESLVLLDASGNHLRSSDALKDLVRLEKLRLANNALQEVSALASLPLLSSIDLEGNDLRDVSGLAGLSRVTQLSLSRNALNDIGPLKSLGLIYTLGLNGNRIQDIEALKGMSALQQLDLSANEIGDLSPLSYLPSSTLRRFDVADNPVAKDESRCPTHQGPYILRHFCRALIWP